jgi:predicted RNA binding protein YcfA (HicA-like mRNA interferase family)
MARDAGELHAHETYVRGCFRCELSRDELTTQELGFIRLLCGMKVRDVLIRLRTEGWSLVRQKGSHRQFKHPTRPGIVTVAGQPNDDVKPGTLGNIARQAGWKE